jgi:hypothetical protein
VWNEVTCAFGGLMVRTARSGLLAATIGAGSTGLLPATLLAQVAVARDEGGSALGQSPVTGAPRVDGVAPEVIAGPAPPLPPEVISRDAAGLATVRAVRLTEPLNIDGRLDDRVYEEVLALSDFIQYDPLTNAPATEKTEAWVFFDRDHLYVSARCWDSSPESQWVANEMRRDSLNIVQNEHIVVLLDTFYDRRNAILFTLNPIGGRMDGQITDERAYNADWNPIWEFRTGRFKNGWTVEMAIPFKSLRYRRGRAQTWGVNFQRYIRWKNEVSALTSLGAGRRGGGGGPSSIFQVHLAGTLVGLEVPESSSTNLEIKPYAISELKTDRTPARPVSNDLNGDLGLDVKYGVTQNLTADFTYNTDFAQVEADEQQVNLTRFSLFFPEKREFFLENQGTFQFGGVGGISSGGGGGGSGGGGGGGRVPTAGVEMPPTLFYSRRVGLNHEGREVPIVAGGRLTGRLGKFSLGLLNIRTEQEPDLQSLATNFSVVRVKRDVLRRSSIGAIFTGRSIAQNGVGSNEAYGVDGTFAFYDNLAINTYWAQTRTDGLSGEDTSYRGQLDYTGDRYGVQLEHVVVGDHFNPEVGYLRRDDMKRSYAQFRFSPRPASIKAVRKFSGMGSINYIEDGAGRLETREALGEFGIEFQNSDRFDVGLTNTYEFLKQPFPIAPGVTVPIGGYEFVNARMAFTLGQQRITSGIISAEHGTFYEGHKSTVGMSRGRVEITPQVSVEPSVSINRVELPYGSFTAKLIASRVTYTMTPLMFLSALLQYNSTSNAVSTNVRLRWEYQPGSELFVVYNDERDTLTRHFPELKNRALIVKVNRLFRF